MTDSAGTPKPLELAAITGAHGVTGEVRLKLFGEGVDALSQIKTFEVGGAIGTLTLKNVRSDKKTGAVARFAEVTDRNAAEKLRGTLLTAPRDTLPQLDAGEYYHVDLVGLSVATDAGDLIGTVTEVVNYGATDILEILKDPAPEKGMKSFMVPITKDAVIEWDTERLVIAAAFAEG